MANPELNPEVPKPEGKIIFFPSEREARIKKLAYRITTYFKGLEYSPDKSNPAYWLDQLNPKNFKLNLGHQSQLDRGEMLEWDPYLAEVRTRLGALIFELKTNRLKGVVIQWDEKVVDKLINAAKFIIEENVSKDIQIQQGWVQTHEETDKGDERIGVQSLGDASIDAYETELKDLLVPKH